MNVNAPSEQAAQALRQMHPDPFVQAATWRLYAQAPGLLDAAAYVALATAEGVTPQAMLETMDAHPRVNLEA